MSADNRLKTVANQLSDGTATKSLPIEKRDCLGVGVPLPQSKQTPPNSGKTKTTRTEPLKSVIPKNRQDLLKWNGWGYKDSKFKVDDDGIIHFTGNRYIIGEMKLPYFTKWVTELFGVEMDKRNVPQPMPLPSDFPEPVLDSSFMDDLKTLNVAFSVTGIDRLVRAHGQILHDIFVLRAGKFERIPDIVVWPDNHDDVVALVNLANRHDVAVIPFGGGTGVTGAVSCSALEKRTIMSLDTSQMNRILWLDRANLLACLESGIVGQDLERELNALGYTSGHEPDSYEFSSLGGWVATRASGMKKNAYGNIEDLLVHVRMVTPAGVLEKNCRAPRVSCGPDFNHLVLGSEGTLGVITEVVLKIRPLPPVKKFGSLAFPDFPSGVACMREVALRRCQPASIRLMDNEQFKFGQGLRETPGYLRSVLDVLKRAYVTKIKGFSVDTMCVATLLFEGDKKAVEAQEKQIYEIAAANRGFPAGATNGERGYTLTLVVAYIRDLALEYDIVAESFETSVAWDRALSLCTNVKHRIAVECKVAGVDRYLISCRVTQTYDAGCCIYFYFGFRFTGLADPLRTYEHIEDMARDEILASGGSLSHHHGIGKIRSKWLPGQVSELGVSLYHAAKRQLDPNNIFASGNLYTPKSNL